MKTLAFQLKNYGDDFRAAASRIREVEVVDIDSSPDAVVSDDNDETFGGKPVLLVGSSPKMQNAPSCKIFPAFPGRFSPQAMTMRESVDSGNLGKPALLRMHVWGTVSDPVNDSARIGAVDLALWFIGEEANAVFLSGNANSESVHLGFASGAMAMLDFTSALPEGECYQSLSLIGSRGAAYADDHRDRNILFNGGAPAATAPAIQRAYIQPMLEDFVRGVTEGRTTETACEEYRKAEKIMRSARQ